MVGAGLLVREDPPVLRVLPIALAALALPIPFLLDAPPVVRTIQAAVFAIWFMRVVEIARQPSRFGRSERIARLLTFFETRMMKRTPRRLRAMALLVSLPMYAAGLYLLKLGISLAPETTPTRRRGGRAGWS